MQTGALAGKTALLTGALGSLGRAQAKLLAENGARLYVLDLPGATQGPAFAAVLSSTTGASVSYVGQDLADLEASHARVCSLISENGPIDILINNAALIINKKVSDFSIADYEQQMTVNSSAAFSLAKAVEPGMAARKYGKIVNLCSLTLNGRWSGYVPYVSSKGAMLGLTKSLARDLGESGIRVNAVSPGAVVSEAEDRVFGDKLAEYNEWILENQCLKQRIQPEDVARLVLFLVSPASDLITGQNIGIDGGW